MAGQDVEPDKELLKGIFPDQQPVNTTIILQTWDKCVFKVELQGDLHNHLPSYIVRLEAEDEKSQEFTTIAALQQIAATTIPEFVPSTLKVGRVSNADGRTFQFSVTEFISGDLLEDLWQQLSTENQLSIVEELTKALSKLSSIRRSDKAVVQALRGTIFEDSKESPPSINEFGGPYTGLLHNGPALLYAIFARPKLKKVFCTIDPVAQGIKIQSPFEELGSVNVPTTLMEQWPHEAGLCHNDLNPRNLILQRQVSTDGESSEHYKLAAIIDWELAGFYPASFQLSLQDTYLGSANRHTSFYLLLKEHMKTHVPRSPSQVVLVQAMELIQESRDRYLYAHNNIPARIRKRFIDASKLIRSSDQYVGWTKTLPLEPLVEFSKSDFDKLENDVIDEVMAARASKK